MVSHAQHLPTLVLTRIFDHILYDDENTFDSSEWFVPVAADALAVAGTCSTWRQIILRKLFKTASAKSTFPPGDDGDYSRWLDSEMLHPSLSAAVHLGASDSIHTVLFCCTIDDLLNEASLGGLRRDSVARTVFRAVSTIKLEIQEPLYQFDIGMIPENADAKPFCDAVERAFPAATTISFDGIDMDWARPNVPFFDQLYLRLLKGKTHIRTDNDIFTMETFGCTQALLRSCQPLREIDITTREGGTSASQIIRQHASTLERLSIVSRDTSILRNVLLGDSDLPVIYPRLHTLKIADDSPTASFIEQFPPGYATFPALEYVDCDVTCPDFVGFLHQSNSGSWVSFVLCTTTSALERLMRKGVFGGHYPAMKNADFICTDKVVKSANSVCAALRVGRCASIISSYTDFSVMFGDVATDIANLNSKVQHIHFPSLTATVEEVLGLTKAQPFMTGLCVSFTLPETQRAAFREHEDCVRGCVCDMREGATGDRSTIEIEDIQSIISSHVGVFLAARGYIEELFAKFHPVSERFTAINVSFCHILREMPPPVEICASLVYLVLLCPSIRTANCSLASGTYALTRSDLQAHAPFRDMEERLLAIAPVDSSS